MPMHESFDAYVEVDGVRLPEHEVTVEPGIAGTVTPTVTCWIPSASGKSFRICCVDTQLPRPATQYLVDLDGMRAGARIKRADHGRFAAGASPLTFRDVQVGGATHALVFSDLKLTDDDDAATHFPNPFLGEIHVAARPVRVTGRRPRTRDRENVTLAQDTIHERSKKAGVHTISIGPVSDAEHSWVVSHEPAGPQIVTFIFKYRPLALLQAQGIAPPPTPAPGPSDEEDDDDGYDPEDAKRLRRLREEMNTIKKRKRLRGDTRVKLESVSQRPRLSNSAESIDLTSD